MIKWLVSVPIIVAVLIISSPEKAHAQSGNPHDSQPQNTSGDLTGFDPYDEKNKFEKSKKGKHLKPFHVFKKRRFFVKLTQPYLDASENITPQDFQKRLEGSFMNNKNNKDKPDTTDLDQFHEDVLRAYGITSEAEEEEYLNNLINEFGKGFRLKHGLNNTSENRSSIEDGILYDSRRAKLASMEASLNLSNHKDEGFTFDGLSNKDKLALHFRFFKEGTFREKLATLENLMAWAKRLYHDNDHYYEELYYATVDLVIMNHKQQSGMLEFVETLLPEAPTKDLAVFAAIWGIRRRYQNEDFFGYCLRRLTKFNLQEVADWYKQLMLENPEDDNLHHALDLELTYLNDPKRRCEERFIDHVIDISAV